MPTTRFKRLILRAVLRDVYPMVIRLVAVPDSLDLTDFDAIFHAVLGWDSGIGYALQIHGQEFNSFQRKTRSKRFATPDLVLHSRFFPVSQMAPGDSFAIFGPSSRAGGPLPEPFLNGGFPANVLTTPSA